jgi:hypothetical protein
MVIVNLMKMLIISPDFVVYHVAVLKMILLHGKTNSGLQFVNSSTLKQQVRM